MDDALLVAGKGVKYSVDGFTRFLGEGKKRERKCGSEQLKNIIYVVLCSVKNGRNGTLMTGENAGGFFL